MSMTKANSLTAQMYVAVLASIVARRVRIIRTAAGLTEHEAARMLGVHVSTYKNWEYGETIIPAWAVGAMAYCYDITPHYLLGLTDDVPIPRMVGPNELDSLAAMAFGPQNPYAGMEV